MRDFDEYWATTGPWPDNILTTAFREVAEKAFQAGARRAAGELGQVARKICGAYAEYGLGPDGRGCPSAPEHEGNHGDILARPLISGVPSQLRPDIPEPAEGWPEHRRRGCTSLHVDAVCPDGLRDKVHCSVQLASQPCAIHDPKPTPACAKCNDRGGYCVYCWEGDL